MIVVQLHWIIIFSWNWKQKVEVTMPELIVLLGEGNYSFACEFVRMLHTHRLLDTTYEVLASDVGPPSDSKFEGDDCKVHDNIRKLIIDYGVRIWTDVDSRNLHNHPRLIADLKSASDLKRIHFIFNFPHEPTAKMKIDLNRSLLRDTFISIEDLSKSCSVEVTIYISLCYGQSGLNQIEPPKYHRSWSDSWQLTEMASYGNFVLVNVCDFSLKSFKKLFCDNIAREKSIYKSNLKFLSQSTSQKNQIEPNLLNFNEECGTLLHNKFENYDPFGYRKQNKPFRTNSKNAFEGGQIFVLEHRDFKLDCFIPRMVYTHPLSSNSLVRKFIDDIGEILLDNASHCRSLKPSLIEQPCEVEWCGQPLDNYILTINLSNSSPQSHYRNISKIIGQYLKESYVGDLLTEDLRIDDITFGFWFKEKNNPEKILSLNLLVVNCLRIKWLITDTRILYSKHFTMLNDPDDSNRTIATTGSLYPQIFYRDYSFWWQSSETLQHKELFRVIWDHFQPTNLLSIRLIEKYIKSVEPIMVSYCFRLSIQSVDLALDRQKVHDLITTLGLRIMTHFPQIKTRS